MSRVCAACGVSRDSSRFPPQLRGDGRSPVGACCLPGLADKGGRSGGNVVLARTLVERLAARGKLYGLTVDQATQKLIDQKLKCPICLCKFQERHKLVHDHDHATGSSRGFVCNSCNLMLGLAEDNKRLLLNAVEYLRAKKGSSC